MTAEVAIINKYAIALAADSAVTLDDGENTKVFTSSNKIFSLSSCQPMGVMIYGSADFMGLPWETIIKNFRRDNKDKEFITVEECRQHFIEYVRNENLHSSSLISSYLAERVSNLLERTVNKFVFMMDSVLSEIKSISQKDMNDAFYLMICRDLELEKQNPLSSENITRSKRFHKSHKNAVEQDMSSRLGALLNRRTRPVLINLISHEIFGDGVHSESGSGIVIAGFGVKENLPALSHVKIEHNVMGYLKYSILADTSIGEDTSAAVYPFAQHDMVARFMDGIDPMFENDLESITQKLIQDNSLFLVNSLYFGEEANRSEVVKLIGDLNEKMLQGFKNKIQLKKREFHAPITRMVDNLPKEELAAMAESLVTIMAIKRRVSIKADTVGGPVDVALITKGDGFVWINRKHYFDKDKNYDFFKRR